MDIVKNEDYNFDILLIFFQDYNRQILIYHVWCTQRWLLYVQLLLMFYEISRYKSSYQSNDNILDDAKNKVVNSDDSFYSIFLKS